jgi:hypothetical protein
VCRALPDEAFSPREWHQQVPVDQMLCKRRLREAFKTYEDANVRALGRSAPQLSLQSVKLQISSAVSAAILNPQLLLIPPSPENAPAR